MDGQAGWTRSAGKLGAAKLLRGLSAFPPFAAAVIVAHLRGSVKMTIDVLVGIFMLARIIHGVSYTKDKPRLRSPAWDIGFTL
jgi:uncharacterized MAPEG superfamily protein